jgi:hypothetical protein
MSAHLLILLSAALSIACSSIFSRSAASNSAAMEGDTGCELADDEDEPEAEEEGNSRTVEEKGGGVAKADAVVGAGGRDEEFSGWIVFALVGESPNGSDANGGGEVNVAYCIALVTCAGLTAKRAVYPSGS